MKTEYDGMKLLSTVLREQGLTRKGDILEFVRNSQLIRLSNRKPVNSKNADFYYSDTKSNFKFDGNSSAYASDLLVASGGGNTISNFHEKIEKLNEKIRDIEKEKSEINKKITYLKQSGAEKFNEKEYRAYAVLQTIKQGGMNDFQKAKLISELIK